MILSTNAKLPRPRLAVPVSAVVPMVVVLLAACERPDDVLFIPEAVPPREIASGLYRVTWHRDADVVRGFTLDGARIVYQSRNLPGFGPGSYVLSVGVVEGDVRGDFHVYQRALLDTIAHVAFVSMARVLVTWRTVSDDAAISCPNCPPPPPAFEIGFRRLPPDGIVPIANIPTRSVRLRNQFTVFSSGCPTHTVRIRPAEREILARLVNPFGPVETADGSTGFYSDGETLWRYEPWDASAPPDSIGPGAFPTLSSDGSLLAAAVATVVDSTEGVCFFGACPCRQETVEIDAAGWEIVLHDLNGGTVTSLGPGLEPAFDPLARRVAVRRPDALYWIELATGTAEIIAGTEGGYAPAVAPDGSKLAFSAETFGNSDVFYVRLR